MRELLTNETSDSIISREKERERERDSKERVLQETQGACKTRDLPFRLPLFRPSLPARARNSARCEPRAVASLSLSLFLSLSLSLSLSLAIVLHSADLRKFKSRIPSFTRTHTSHEHALGALAGVGEPENWFPALSSTLRRSKGANRNRDVTANVLSLGGNDNTVASRLGVHPIRLRERYSCREDSPR